MSSKTFVQCGRGLFVLPSAVLGKNLEYQEVCFMDVALLLEYGWVLLVLIALEGILAADNALVMAVMVKHLPEKQRRKALFYGLFGAFVLRISSLFAISFLVNVWQVQAIGAIYLIYIALHHLIKKHFLKNNEKEKTKNKKESGFWMTVLKVELADIAFAVDSILAAVALAVTLPSTSLPSIGGMDGGQFLVVFLGGFIGVIIMRYAATWFVSLLQKRPNLETAAFFIVGWVGVKLSLYTLAHPEIGIVSSHFIHSTTWKLIFWAVLIMIAILGWVLSKEKESPIEKEYIRKVE